MNKSWTAIIVVLVIIAGIWWFKGNSSDVALAPSASASPTVMASKTPVVVKKTVSPVAPASTPTQSYSQLVQQYGNNRIQFDSNCQAQPKTVVFENGTRILLDNRANQTSVIGLNGQTYTLGAYGYQAVTLSSSSVPKVLSLSCNSLVNVGTIQLQANILGQ